MSVTEGTIPFIVQGETYQTWYKMFGDLAARTHRPLVVLHGGPGMSHDYLIPISDLAESASVPVIFYDQLGNARSTHLRDKNAEFWTVDLFIDELANLLSYFGIQDDFDVLGHSWGGMLGAEFAVRRQPLGLKHLILADSLAELRLWNESIAMLRKRLPQDVQDILQEHEKSGTTSSPEYKEALFKFYERFGWTVRPAPKEMLFSLEQPEKDPTVPQAMGTIGLKDWKITDRLHLVQVPSLVINGQDDMAQDFVCAPFFHNIQKVKWIKFSQSSHVPHWEERQRYMEEVAGFLSNWE